MVNGPTCLPTYLHQLIMRFFNQRNVNNNNYYLQSSLDWSREIERQITASLNKSDAN